MKLILVGQQGAGKGTIAALIKDKLNLPHISTGDIFRAAIKEGTELGKRVQEILKSGALVPDDVTTDIVKERLTQEDCKDGFILDGFPRNLNQAELLAEEMPVDKVVLLNIKDDLTVYRLSARRVCKGCSATFNVNPDGFPQPKETGKCDACGGELYQRDDDKEEAIRARLKIYHNETEPMLKFYEDKGILKTVDSSREVTLIVEDVLHVIQ